MHHEQATHPLKLVLIPVWLERLFKAHGVGLETVLDPAKFSSIVSTRDVEMYDSLQDHLFLFIGETLDSLVSEDGSEPVRAIMNDEDRRRYRQELLYGALDTQPGEAHPYLAVRRIGGETLALTVVPDRLYNARETTQAIMAEWRASNALHVLASHPITAHYLSLL